MKYKVGDKVIIKPKEEFVHSKYRNPHGSMDIYCGRAAVIVSQGFDYYRIDIDGGFWNWYDDMLEDNNVGMYGELRGFNQMLEQKDIIRRAKETIEAVKAIKDDLESEVELKEEDKKKK